MGFESLAHKVLAVGLLLTSLSGCKTTVPYVNNDANVRLQIAKSEFHTVTYVRAYEEDGELVLFGNVDHHHGDCAREPHVEIEITDAGSDARRVVKVPLRRGSTYRYGWHRASFRTKVRPVPEPGSRIEVTVRDERCASAGIECDGKATAPSR